MVLHLENDVLKSRKLSYCYIVNGVSLLISIYVNNSSKNCEVLDSVMLYDVSFNIACLHKSQCITAVIK